MLLWAFKGLHAMELKETTGMKFKSKYSTVVGHVVEDFIKTKEDVALKELDSFCSNKPRLDIVAHAQVREKQVITYFSVDELFRSVIVGSPGAMAEAVEKIARDTPEGLAPG
jgi:hypothetical protein